MRGVAAVNRGDGMWRSGDREMVLREGVHAGAVQNAGADEVSAFVEVHGAGGCRRSASDRGRKSNGTAINHWAARSGQGGGGGSGRDVEDAAARKTSVFMGRPGTERARGAGGGKGRG